MKEPFMSGMKRLSGVMLLREALVIIRCVGLGWLLKINMKTIKVIKTFKQRQETTGDSIKYPLRLRSYNAGMRW